MKRHLAVVVVVAMAALLAAGFVSRSNAAPQSASVAHATTIPLLRVGLGQTVPTLDLARYGGATSVTSLGLETLMQLGPDGKLRPWLAQRVTQPGRAVYVYHLRRGVKFWNGHELTAEDVANSLNYARFPTSAQSYTFPSVKSIVATGRYTVAVTLKHPDATWRYTPATYGAQIFEKAFQLENKGDFGKPGRLVMGTGPWKVDSLEPTKGAELSANPNYWGGKVPIQRISIKFFSDETSMALAFRSDAIDVALQVSGAFASAGATKLVSVPSCQQALFGMNTKVAPWSDVHVRRAVAYALNRPDLIRANGGYATPNFTLIPPSQLSVLGTQSEVNALLKSLPQYPYSLTKARQELAKSAYPSGFSASLDEHNLLNLATISQAIAGQLAKIGINLKVDVKTISEWVGDLTTPPRLGYGAAYTPSGCNSPDPGFYSFFLGTKGVAAGGFNFANYAPPAVDKLIAAGERATNPTKRLAIYGQLLKQLALDVPYVPLWVQTGNLAIKSKFTWPNFDAAYFNRTWGLEIKAK